MQKLLLACLVGAASALKLPQMPRMDHALRKLPAAAVAASVTAHAEMVSAKAWTGTAGALDFGPLAGNQPGGEGTGKPLGISEDALLGVLLVVTITVFGLFAQWQSYQVRGTPTVKRGSATPVGSTVAGVAVPAGWGGALRPRVVDGPGQCRSPAPLLFPFHELHRFLHTSRRSCSAQPRAHLAILSIPGRRR